MVVVVALFEFHLPHSRGLKEKRAFLRPLKARLRGAFEISASEVAHQDLLQRAAVALAAVGSGRDALEPFLQKIVDWVEGYAEESGAEVSGFTHEWIEYGDVGSEGLGPRAAASGEGM